jgi:hypothetical protein
VRVAAFFECTDSCSVARRTGHPPLAGKLFDNLVAVELHLQELIMGNHGQFLSDLCTSLRSEHWIVTHPKPIPMGFGVAYSEILSEAPSETGAQATGAFKRRGQDQCGQATKGVWGMPWRQEAMKGVEDCDKPGEAVKRALIPGCPNGRIVNS